MKFFSLFLILSLVFVAEELTSEPGLSRAVPRVEVDKPVASTFEEYKVYFHDLVEAKGAKLALVDLEKEMNESEIVFEYCHALAHEVGHAAYELYGFEDALIFEEDLCGAGYLHGVVEDYLGEQTDMLSAMRTVCDLDDGVCLHGVGHGLMIYANNDIPEALSYCEEFESYSAQIHCSEGVFMENFGLDWNLHAHPYLKLDDPMYPCSEQEEKYKNTCYFYAPRFFNRLYEGAYEQAIDWCNTAEAAYVQDCVRGVGSTMMKYSMDEIERIEGVCNGAGDYSDFCIRGMTSYYIVNYASAEKGYELCAVLKEENQEACEAEVAAKSPFYQD